MYITAEVLAYVIRNVYRSVLKKTVHFSVSVCKYAEETLRYFALYRHKCSAIRPKRRSTIWKVEGACEGEHGLERDQRSPYVKSIFLTANLKETKYVNELLGLEKQKKLLTGAFPDKIQEGNLSIKVILALHYYSVKHTVCPGSSDPT